MSVQKWHHEVIGQRVVEALKNNEFEAVYVPTRQKAAEYVLNFIKPGDSIGMGGSATLGELDITPKITGKGAHILNQNQPGLSPEEKDSIRHRQLISDVFLCSSNAITLDGYLVNVDGVGNRVAAMTFGPKKVVVVAGINKICEDVQAAFRRIALVAAPQNNKRLGLPNPCVVTGICADCRAKTRVCRIFSVMKRKPMLSDITVVVVGESLGY
ncbi:MAG: lactate utilization protein [Desulfitobacteriaceae bacterium]|nr:lactate utilization protein [Desulfitobacteriaceae bacterium]MDD4751689.1 lactate utilization protein [Desulfitobacteriaceae bacterium]